MDGVDEEKIRDCTKSYVEIQQRLRRDEACEPIISRVAIDTQTRARPAVTVQQHSHPKSPQPLFKQCRFD
jgi:hypothetical protein